MEVKRFKEIPNTVFEYYPGNKVLVKTTDLGVNTLIQVYKPGMYPYYNNNCSYSINPVALISMNGTGVINGDTFGKLQKKLDTAIQILNNEGDGKITLDKLSINMSDTAEQAHWKESLKAKQPTKYIRQKDLIVGHIYEEVSGRKTLYLGNSHYYERIGSCIQHSNRSNDGHNFANLVYGEEDLINLLHRGYNSNIVEICGIKMYVIQSLVKNARYVSAYIDTYATLRKFTKDLGEIIKMPPDCRVIVFNTPLNKNCDDGIDCIVVNRNIKTPHMSTSFVRRSIYQSNVNSNIELQTYDVIREALMN